MSEEKEVKFSICAMIDLLGFSSHLEISAYDFRTSIGKQAVSRLENLESVLEILNSEKEKRGSFYADNVKIQRMNDAIFLTMDLDDALIPSIGQTKFQGFSADDMEKVFTEDELKDETALNSARDTKINKLIEPLQKFIGVVSRMHLYLNKLEGIEHFPGVKTVISTGFRRPFQSKTENKEDFFSANFALSNVFISEKRLDGPNLYVDNNIVQMLSYNQFVRHVIQFSHFHFRETPFDCFNVDEHIFSLNTDANVPDPIEMELFRKDYVFRRLNPSPLSYLQNIPKLIPYLNEDEEPILNNIFYKHVYHAIKIGLSDKMIDNFNPPSSFIYNGTNDLSVDIGVFCEYLSDGESKTRKKQQKDRILKTFSLENASEDDERYKKVMEFLNKEIEVDLHPINIDQFREIILQFSEKQLTDLMPILQGDTELLDYQYGN